MAPSFAALSLGDGGRARAATGAGSPARLCAPGDRHHADFRTDRLSLRRADDRRAAACRAAGRSCRRRPVRPARLQAATRRAGSDRAGRGRALAHDRLRPSRPLPSARASSLAFGFDIWPTWAHSIARLRRAFRSRRRSDADDLRQCAAMLGAPARSRSARSSASSIPVADRGLARLPRGPDERAGRRCCVLGHVPGDAARLQLRHADDDRGGARLSLRALRERAPGHCRARRSRWF